MGDVATAHARLASGWLARLCREGVEPSGSQRKVSEFYISFPFPGFILTLTVVDPLLALSSALGHEEENLPASGAGCRIVEVGHL